VTRWAARSISISAVSIANPGARTDAPRRSFTIGAGSCSAISEREQISFAAKADAYSAGSPSNSGPGGVGRLLCCVDGRSLRSRFVWRCLDLHPSRRFDVHSARRDRRATSICFGPSPSSSRSISSRFANEITDSVSARVFATKQRLPRASTAAQPGASSTSMIAVGRRRSVDSSAT
jgi:hypothetical protein